MKIDLSRFKQTFLDESREGLAAMESGLLALEQGSTDGELINTVFRAAHSIKGGAGTFGFGEITEVTHLLETLLDQMRAGKRAIDAQVIGLLLRAVDAVRALLDIAERGGVADGALVTGQIAALSTLLRAPALTPPSAAQEREGGRPPKAADAGSGWRIRFAPHAHLLRTGNEPMRLLRELAGLGPVTIAADVARLPPLADCDPESAYLAWDITLDAPVPRATIEELFAWVEGDCDLRIQSLLPAAAAPSVSPKERGDVSVRATGGGARAEAAAPSAMKADSSIRVNVEKVDALINLVGELVITQSMLRQVTQNLDPKLHEDLLNRLTQLDRNTRELQDAVMSVRMLPIDFVFNRFPRMVRDLAGELGKKVALKTIGEGTELDKGVIEKITDPLTHLVRNSLDHGLEPPQERLAAGKSETGTITLKAWQQGGYIFIEVADDGRGLDREKILASVARRGQSVPDDISDAEVWQLIFLPGLSTADKVTDLSGRGVGMDVVKKNIVALGGQVEVRSSRGLGTSVNIRLPLTLAILDGMSVAVGDQTFILPLASVVESLRPAAEDIKTVAGKGRLVRVRAEYLPLVPLHALFRGGVAAPEAHEGIVVILEHDGRKVAALADQLLGQQQVVIKSLETNYRRVDGISGATILGDGRVALILDVASLTRSVSHLPLAA